MKRVSSQNLRNFMTAVLSKEGVRGDVSRSLTQGLLHASLRGVDSHGIGLFPHYVSGVKHGRINKNPSYNFKKTAAATGVLDADHTFGHAAGIEGTKHVIELAKTA